MTALPKGPVVSTRVAARGPVHERQGLRINRQDQWIGVLVSSKGHPLAEWAGQDFCQRSSSFRGRLTPSVPDAKWETTGWRGPRSRTMPTRRRWPGIWSSGIDGASSSRLR